MIKTILGKLWFEKLPSEPEPKRVKITVQQRGLATGQIVYVRGLKRV